MRTTGVGGALYRSASLQQTGPGYSTFILLEFPTQNGHYLTSSNLCLLAFNNPAGMGDDNELSIPISANSGPPATSVTTVTTISTTAAPTTTVAAEVTTTDPTAVENTTTAAIILPSPCFFLFLTYTLVRIFCLNHSIDCPP